MLKGWGNLWVKPSGKRHARSGMTKEETKDVAEKVKAAPKAEKPKGKVDDKKFSRKSRGIGKFFQHQDKGSS